MKQTLPLFFALLLSAHVSFAQWEKVTNPEAFQTSNYITSNGGKLYVAVNSGVFVSADNGVTWTNTNSASASPAMAPKGLAATGSHLYAAGVYGGSGDFASPLQYDGQSWKADTVGLPSAETRFLFTDNDRVFIARSGNTSLSLYTKLDSESSWTAVTSLPVPNAVFVLYKLNNTYYAITGGYRKVWSSTDGISFTETTHTIPSDAVTAYSSSNAAYIATGDGLYKTTDGTSFSRIDVGFAPWVVGTPIGAVYANGNKVYAAVMYTDSAYESTDAGTTWSSISGGEITNSISSFTVHNNAVFATQTAWGATATQIIRYGTPSTTTGIRSQTTNGIQVSIFPNPASSLVTVDVNEPADIRLYNLNGALQLQTNLSTFDVSHLVGGIYLLQVTTATGVSTHKLVIE